MLFSHIFTVYEDYEKQFVLICISIVPKCMGEGICMSLHAHKFDCERACVRVRARARVCVLGGGEVYVLPTYCFPSF